MANIDSLGFTMDDLKESIRVGDVRSQTHPEFPELSIFNYCEDVQFRNRWNSITLACRGLILNTNTGQIVARPWEKFFNLGQRDNAIDSSAPVEVTDKLDGSLGILYKRPDGELAIATRGSFVSEQALEATAMLYATYRQDFENFYVPVDSETFLFEIIYPENRIVVNYGDQRDLILLGSVNKKYGYYYGPDAAAGLILWNGPVAETFYAENFVASISLPDRKGKEGYIIRSGNKIVKLKQSDYVELHRIVTNLSPKTIWEMMAQGKTVDDICAGIPDEFYKYVSDIAEELNFKASTIKFEAALEFAQAKQEVWSGPETTVSRRQWANVIKKRQHASLLFNMLDGKDIDSQIWKMIRPRGDVKSLVQDDG